MTIKNSNARSKEEKFRKEMKIRAIIMAGYTILGLAIIIFAFIAVPNEKLIGSSNVYSKDTFWVMGSVMIAAGIAKLATIIGKIKDPEKFQKAYTEYTDERNRFVIMKTYQTTAYVFIYFMALATVVASFVNSTVSAVFASCIGVFALISNITYRVMKRKY